MALYATTAGSITPRHDHLRFITCPNGSSHHNPHIHRYILYVLNAQDVRFTAVQHSTHGTPQINRVESLYKDTPEIRTPFNSSGHCLDSQLDRIVYKTTPEVRTNQDIFSCSKDDHNRLCTHLARRRGRQQS